MGLKLLAGRWVDPELDAVEGPATAVVSRTLAEALTLVGVFGAVSHEVGRGRWGSAWPWGPTAPAL